MTMHATDVVMIIVTIYVNGCVKPFVRIVLIIGAAGYVTTVVEGSVILFVKVSLIGWTKYSIRSNKTINSIVFFFINSLNLLHSVIFLRC